MSKAKFSNAALRVILAIALVLGLTPSLTNVKVAWADGEYDITVTFNTDGGTAVADMTAEWDGSGNYLTENPTTTKANSELTGWQVVSEGDDEADLDVGLTTEDFFNYDTNGDFQVTIQAQWTETAPLDGTWVETDFTWDGGKVTGLTDTGKARLAVNSEVTIPETLADGTPVTAIGAGTYAAGVFSDGTLNPTKVTIPSTVTSIGDWAFKSFAGETIELPSSLTTLGMSVFNASSLTSLVIPDSVTTIGNGLCTNSANLASITIGAGMTEIPQSFANMTAVKTVSIPAQITKINKQAFAGNYVTSLTFEGDSVTEIGEQAYLNNQLETLEIPASVKTIGKSAFRVYQTDLEKKLATLTLNEGLETISQQAFDGNLLTKVDLPSTVISVDARAFMNNKGTYRDADVTADGCLQLNVTEDSQVENFNGGYTSGGVTTYYHKAVKCEKYTVKFDLGDHGTEASQPADQTLIQDPDAEDATIYPTKPADPVDEEGYSFCCWNEKDPSSEELDQWDFDDHSLYNVPSSITLSEDNVLTLYAKWYPTPYKVTFAGVDGATNPNGEITYTVESTEDVALQNASKDGYTFKGWFDEDGEQWTEIKAGTIGDVTLTAQWEAITYHITYAGVDGATNPNTVTEFTVESEAIPLQAATKDGYTFKGWKDAEGNDVTEIAAGTMGDVTLTAQWEKNAEPTPDPATETVAVFRLYNPYSGEHLYTTDSNEKESLVGIGWNDEGTGWQSPASSKVSVYRLYNPYSSDHHYTTDETEKDTLVALGWNDEGVAFLSAAETDEGAVKVYRQFNPYETVGTHNFTTDENEKDYICGIGWNDEGVAWYALEAETTEE